MTNAAAFQATYSDWKLIRTRKVVQIVLEIPVEGSDQAYQALDGMPNSGEEVWVAVARLKTPEDVPAAPEVHSDRAGRGGGTNHKSWHEMAPAQQAGILCSEQSFWRFLNETYPANITNGDGATLFVRDFCGVASRSDIRPQSKAHILWSELTSEYRGWMREPETVF